ncbi:thiamine pyrophosphate-binding protein [Albidovulum sediminicola]|uniref:Thiamine pyrophosphate-binding protein n=1 Tax=Albidovulum sediminicola TaxID=2984331 RepID=A0ABT2YWZ5_9RHOB|nr:thiamine pyrophosphate-binding protein [Defluviimonas sp. WL0075]MCV2863387.1 thiamine pyrophosphate-binding protein [Defluviimonas sp. WL0075]
MAETAKPNAMTGAEALVRMLDAYEVRHIFGLCGDTTLPFYDALYRLDHKIEHILTRDERSAAYMADGYARVTKKVGVCEGPSGGGATYILPGLVEANESSVPVLAITSDVGTRAKGHYPLTELDQQGLMRPLTKFNTVIQHADAVPDAVRTAFRTMTTGRPGSAHLGLPIDVQRGQANPDDIWADPAHARFPAYPFGADPAAVEAALDAILSARFPIVICGGGIVLAGGEAAFARFVEALDIAVATTISGQGSIAETHPNCVGVVGSNGGVPATRELVQRADLVVFIGCRAGSVTTELWRYPAKGTRIVHIDSDPEVIGASYRTEVGVVSDARLALDALNAALEARGAQPGFGGAAAIAPLKARKWEAFHRLSSSAERPIRPERTIAALRKVLDDDAIVVGDPGTPCPYISAFYELRTTGRKLFSNRAHGALGYALSASVGAAVGAPGKKIVALMGDGSFGFTCGELETVVRLNLPITFIVFSNAVYGWIKAGQRSAFEGRYYSVDFGRTDHRAVAEAFGLRAWQVEDPEKLEGILREAANHPGPTLVDILSQPLNEAAAPVSEWIA